MSFFPLRIHQNRCRLGIRPRPHWRVYSAPLDPVAGFKGAALRQEGNGGVRREGLQERGRGEGRGKRGSWGIAPWLLGIDAPACVLQQSCLSVRVSVRLSVCRHRNSRRNSWTYHRTFSQRSLSTFSVIKQQGEIATMSNGNVKCTWHMIFVTFWWMFLRKDTTCT